METHRKVFLWVLGMLAEEGLAERATPLPLTEPLLEANAALRSIVRRDTGEAYDDFLKGLAKESGIETPTREQLARLERRRKKKGSNDDWKNPHDPDAQITKMKRRPHSSGPQGGACGGPGDRRSDRGNAAAGDSGRYEDGL